MVTVTSLLLPIIGVRILAERKFQRFLKTMGVDCDDRKTKGLWRRYWKSLGRPSTLKNISLVEQKEFFELSEHCFVSRLAIQRQEVESRLAEAVENDTPTPDTRATKPLTCEEYLQACANLDA